MLSVSDRALARAPLTIVEKKPPIALAESFRLRLEINKLQPRASAVKTRTAAISPIVTCRIWPSIAPNHPPAPPRASTPVKASGPLKTCKIPRADNTTPPHPRANFTRLGASSPRSCATPIATNTNGKQYRPSPSRQPRAVSAPRPTGPASRA